MAVTIQRIARKLRSQLDEADENGYGKDAWYFYMDRHDVEALVSAALSFNPNPIPCDECAAKSGEPCVEGCPSFDPLYGSETDKRGNG